MPAATVLRGYQGTAYIGTAGSAAATQLVERTDVRYNLKPEYADSTSAGDGSSVPLKSSEIVAIAAEITFTMIYKTEDANIATLISAAAAGTPLAFLLKSVSTGSTRFDGDCFVDLSQSLPLAENQKFEVTMTPTRRLRVPTFA